MNRLILARCLVCALALGSPLALNAQHSLDSVRTGDLVHVRARATGAEGVRGVVERTDGDSLVLRAGRGQERRAFAVDSLWRLDLARHYPAPARRVAFDAGIGAGAGLLIGAGIVKLGQIVRPDCGDCAFGPTSEEERLWADENSRETKLGALVGGAAGAALLAWRRVRRGVTDWSQVPLSSSASGAGVGRTPRYLTLEPLRHGLAVSVRF